MAQTTPSVDPFLEEIDAAALARSRTMILLAVAFTICLLHLPKKEEAPEGPLPQLTYRANGLVLDHDAPPPSDLPPRYAPFFFQPLDINTATATELTMVPGIGPGLAGRIIDYRRRHGNFPAGDHHPLRRALEAVPGIGPHKAARLAPWLTANP